jgi:hypothetical protein
MDDSAIVCDHCEEVQCSFITDDKVMCPQPPAPDPEYTLLDQEASIASGGGAAAIITTTTITTTTTTSVGQRDSACPSNNTPADSSAVNVR